MHDEFFDLVTMNDQIKSINTRIDYFSETLLNLFFGTFGITEDIGDKRNFFKAFLCCMIGKIIFDSIHLNSKSLLVKNRLMELLENDQSGIDPSLTTIMGIVNRENK